MQETIIHIFNEQEIIAVSSEIESLIKNAVKCTLLYEKINRNVEINVLLVDNQEIRSINLANREIDAETDVLSFPMLEFDEEHHLIEQFIVGDYDHDNDALLLGDIVISLEKAAMQANEYGHAFSREVGFLTVHSMLHLLGYDHIQEEDRQTMRAKEEAILEKMDLQR